MYGDDNYAYFGDHCAVCTNTEPLHCTPKTSIIYQLYLHKYHFGKLLKRTKKANKTSSELIAKKIQKKKGFQN